MKYKVLGILSVALFAVPVSAENMKPGLWEMATGSSVIQQQMASLPPAERKQMKDMLAKQGIEVNDSGMVAVKVCVTPEMAKRDMVPVQQDGDCTTTTSPRSGNTVKITLACKTNPPVRGEGEVTFQSDTAYSAKMRTEVGSQSMDSETSGRWLGADCGNVKPMQLPSVGK